jgi:hypothetical protein
MNAVHTGLPVLALPAAIVLAGYWLAARLTHASALERLAFAALAGLSTLLWTVSVVNFFRPIDGLAAWLCLWPVALTLAIPRLRRGLARDLVAGAGHRRGALLLLTAGLFLAFLVWPLLSQPALVFYDGTANHDAFFWITGADHLRHHDYMTPVVRSAAHPAANFIGAIVGWLPEWGRMGGEGWLALWAALFRTTPLQLYLAATAALFVPWIAAVALIARTFFLRRLTWPVTLALVALQPLFVFFHANANFPNLLGALAGATVVVATERSLRDDGARGAWLALLALGLHALLCCYPEMVPFVALPAGLLWARAAVRSRRLVWSVPLAVAAGLALNPASTVRGFHGIVFTIDAVGAPDWANIFRPLAAAARPPALATLSVHLGHDLGAVGGALCSLVLLGAAVFAILRARDRFGSLALFAGAAALLAYTVASGYGYGWQKTAQFAAPALAALFSAGAIGSLAASRAPRLFRWPALATLVAILGSATVLNTLDAHKWSRRKSLTRDWFALRDYARDHLRGAPVLIDGAGFDYPFFHTMWAAYFLSDSAVAFAGRDSRNGGYLHATALDEAGGPLPAPAAILAGRSRAAARPGPDSPPLVTGGNFALLQASHPRPPAPQLPPLP